LATAWLRRGSPVRKILGISWFVLAATTLTPTAVWAQQELLDLVLAEQQRRVEMIDRVLPAVVCVNAPGADGGGSGILIDPDGYGLTNFHVVRNMLRTRKGWGGLNNGEKYELEVLGIDPTGDVAMFRLHGRDNFSFATLGDSDAVSVGDSAVAIGNPFSLATDFQPSVTFGMVTDVHRYQWGVGNNLIYSDCIQVDTSINPGNSGGPLFNMDGEVIGINGRISVNTRGRFNVGFGYAISANQIKMFVASLRAGHVARHGTLLAHVEGNEVVKFANIIPEGAADEAGIEFDDVLKAIDRHPIRSANHYVSVMGTYPADRHVRVDLVRRGQPMTVIARLASIKPKLSSPYILDRNVNRTEAERTLSALRKTTGVPPATGMLECTLHQTGVDPDESISLRLRLDLSNAQLRLARLRADGTEGRLIVHDGEVAREMAGSEGEAYEMDTIDQLAYAALRHAMRLATSDPESFDYDEIVHQGGDALIRLDNTCGDEVVEVGVIDWEAGADMTVQAQVGTESNRLERVTATDKPSGQQVTIDFCGDNPSGDLVLPSRIIFNRPRQVVTWTSQTWEVKE
jgi:S1-C subfamily serine protease